MSGRTISGIFSILSGKIGGLILGVIITPILVRILGSEQYGDYALLLAIFSITTTLTHAGISAGIRKYMSDELSTSTWKSQVYSYYMRFGLFIAIIFAIGLVMFGLYAPVDALFGSGFSIYLLLLALMLFTDQIFYINRYALIGLNVTHISEPLKVFKQVLYGLFGITLAYIGYDIAGILVGTVIASLLSSGIAIWLLRYRITLQDVLSPVPASFPRKDLLTYNLHNTVFVLLTISLYNVDILLLQPIVGSQQTGLYKAALVITEFVWLVPTAIQIIFVGSASNLWSRNKHKEITEMASKATRFTLSFTVLLIIGLAALSTEFIWLYFGTEFSDAVLPLLILLPGVLCFAISRPIYAIGQGKGELRILIVATGSAALINLLLNVVLIPQYEMVGAAVATSIGYSSMLVFHILAAKNIGFNPLVDLRLKQIGIAGIITAMVVFATTSITNSAILSLILVPPLGFFTYVCFSLRLEVISSEELEMVANQFPNKAGQLILKTARICRK